MGEGETQIFCLAADLVNYFVEKILKVLAKKLCSPWIKISFDFPRSPILERADNWMN